MQNISLKNTCSIVALAALLAACNADDNLPANAPEAALAPQVYVGNAETRSVVIGTSTDGTNGRINKVMLFVTKNTDGANNTGSTDGHTPYPEVGSDGLSTFTLTAGTANETDKWIGSPAVNLSNEQARIFAFSPYNALFTASKTDQNHTIKVTIPADQTFDGTNLWDCSVTDYLYGSASGTPGEATAITANNAENGGGTPAYKPEISMQHALSLLVFTMQSQAGRTVDATYDYVQKITLSVTGGTKPFLVTTTKDAGTMLIKDGTLTPGSNSASLTFTPSGSGNTSTAVCCGASGRPATVGYGLVAPLAGAPNNLTVTVLLGKKDGSDTNQRELSATLTAKQWQKGNRYYINLTLSDRAITATTGAGSITDWSNGWSDNDSQGNGELKPDGFK